MSNGNEKTLTRKDIEDELTRQNLSKPFEEFPKYLYHPDGRTQVVRTRTEQDATGGDWFERPQEAIDEKTKRDKRASEKFVADVNAEAAEKTGASEPKPAAKKKGGRKKVDAPAPDGEQSH